MSFKAEKLDEGKTGLLSSRSEEFNTGEKKEGFLSRLKRSASKKFHRRKDEEKRKRHIGRNTLEGRLAYSQEDLATSTSWATSTPGKNGDVLHSSSSEVSVSERINSNSRRGSPHSQFSRGEDPSEYERAVPLTDEDSHEEDDYHQRGDNLTSAAAAIATGSVPSLCGPSRPPGEGAPPLTHLLTNLRRGADQPTRSWRDRGDNSESSSFSLASGLPDSWGEGKPSKTKKVKDLRSKKGSSDPILPFYSLHVTLLRGRDLIARDRNGFSDPYVKFRYDSHTVYKSQSINKTLNPVWKESFVLLLDHVNEPVAIQVFDKDTLSSDDAMGGAVLDLKDVPLNGDSEVVLSLEEDSLHEPLGTIELSCRLCEETGSTSATGESGKHKRHKKQDSICSAKTAEWDYVVHVVLVRGRNLLAMDDTGLSDPYVRFKLGAEKYKTKIRKQTLDPVWLEEFSLNYYEDQADKLELHVYDYNIASKADTMGRACVDLSQLEREKTVSLEQELLDGAGFVHLLITITGTVRRTVQPVNCDESRTCLERHYNLSNSFKNLKDVGWLQVKVVRAHDLPSKDWDGKSDPYCTVELVNHYRRTQTIYKTLHPEWRKVFHFPVEDVHSYLEVTVYDEDKDRKSEFIGKVSIPLCRIDCGQPKWYGLKDKKMFKRGKGAILLEMDVIFNQFKSAIRTFNPREEQTLLPEQKFKVSMFKQHLSRVRALVDTVLSVRDFTQSLFNWDQPVKTIIAFVAYLVAVWNIELYMVPLTLLGILLWMYVMKEGYVDESLVELENEVAREESEEEQEGKKTIGETIQIIQNVCLTVQSALDGIASLGERLKNTFNWSVPWLSGLTVIILMLASFLLYFIPVRYIALIWGINKFTKKLRKPNHIPNNEMLDFLSRVPSDIEKIQLKEYRPANIDPNDPYGPLTMSKKLGTTQSGGRKKTN